MTETKLVRYAAHIPYTGSIYFEFDAPEGLDEDEMMDAAWVAMEDLPDDAKEIEEETYHIEVTEGNCFRGVRAKLEVYRLVPKC